MPSEAAEHGNIKIKQRYTLLTHIPVYLFADGTLRTTPLWQKDLALHLEYLADLHLACPALTEMEAGDTPLAVVEGLAADRVHHIAQNIGWAGVLKNIVPHFLAMGRVARDSDIVHGAAGGWPFPLLFYFLFWRRIYRFKWFVGVESSFWRMEPGEKRSLRKRLSHHMHMVLVPMCLRSADARYFTQSEYRDSLLGSTENTLINPAVWYEEDDIETSERLVSRQAERAERAPAKALFPARMEVEKGVGTVMAAIRHLEMLVSKNGRDLEVDFIGEGAMADAARDFANTWTGHVRLRFLEPVPYGSDFFKLIREYDAVIVANRKAEQPRIVFDAFSQGVPLITSETTGVLDIVRPGVDCETFPVDDANALAARLAMLASDPDKFAQLGRAGLETARKFTHRRMHEVRRDFLIDVFGT